MNELNTLYTWGRGEVSQLNLSLGEGRGEIMPLLDEDVGGGGTRYRYEA